MVPRDLVYIGEVLKAIACHGCPQEPRSTFTLPSFIYYVNAVPIQAFFGELAPPNRVLLLLLHVSIEDLFKLLVFFALLGARQLLDKYFCKRLEEFKRGGALTNANKLWNILIINFSHIVRAVFICLPI